MGSTHLKAYRNVSGAQVAAVVSSDEKKLSGDLSGIQGNIGGPGEKMDFSALKKYRTVREALADRDIDAVDICLPTDQHGPVGLEALRAGKHVLVEKPMALDGETADRMVAEARKNGVVLMTGQVLRFIGSYRSAKELIASGKLGPVRAAIFRRRCAAPAWSRWLGNAAQSGGGVFDLLIHDIDYCLYIFGKPSGVAAEGYEEMPRGIDWITARLHYPGIGAVIVSGGWHHPKAFPFSMEFTIVAEEGTLEYNSSGTPLTLYDARGEACVLPVVERDFFEAELEYFVQCASEHRRPELCPPEESAAAVKLAKLMVESRSRNGETIRCSF